MLIKQIESTAGLIVSIFGTAAFGAIVTAAQTGQVPQTWPQWQHVLGGAALAGATAVFGWLKLRSPMQPPPEDKR